MGERMENAPVFYTVAQIRFNPVLNLESYLAVIQDRMRGAGFPDFRREIAHQLVLPFGKNESGQPLPPSFAAQARYIFNNIEGKSGFVIENNAIAFQTTDYNTHESFLNTYQEGVCIVNDALRLAFTERIGLRYLDAILPKSDESLSDYLITEVLGLSKKLTGNPFRHSFSETVVTADVGQLVSRVIIRDGNVGLPLELAPLALKLDECFTKTSCRHAILDIDAFKEAREPFDSGKIKTKLKELHSEIDRAFKSIVTPHALATWR